MSDSVRPLLTVDDLRKSAAAPRSRWSRLFGVTAGDLEAAKKRLVQALETSTEPPSVRERVVMSDSLDTPDGTDTQQEATKTSVLGADDDQGLLFTDDVSPQPSGTGYRGPTACNAAGITYRQLDYWARTGLVEPSVRGVTGAGSQRLYSFRDILVLKVVKRLLDAGISLQQIRTAVAHLREYDDPTSVTLMSDGRSVYECTSNDEVIDLLQGGQGIFGISIRGVWQEITEVLATLPTEAAATPKSAPPVDESDPHALAAWQQFREALNRVDKLSPREQVEVANLFSELHMSAQLSELEGVVDLEAARQRRSQAGTQLPAEAVQASEG